MIVWTDAHLSPALAAWLCAAFGVDGNTTNAAPRLILTDAWPRVAALLAAGEPLVGIGGRAV